MANAPVDPNTAPSSRISLWQLWKEFLPLSLSDVTMALCDPLVTATLAQLPGARASIAAVGVAKTTAIFFESPIIMILHASNALAASRASRRALLRFTLALAAVLSLGIALLTIPIVFSFLADTLFDLNEELRDPARTALALLIPWPFIIAVRRFVQGMLIRFGHGADLGRAGLVRIAVTLISLGACYALALDPEILAGITLIAGIAGETTLVLIAERRRGAYKRPDILNTQSAAASPTTIPSVAVFYAPLAGTMLTVWGGRVALTAIVARSVDASIALAAWPAAMGIIILIANSTRMVQQIAIAHRSSLSIKGLVQFATSVGFPCALALFLLGATPIGKKGLVYFVGGDLTLLDAVATPIAIATLAPLLVVFQNLLQGLLIAEKRSRAINVATVISTIALLGAASLFVSTGVAGATAAAVALCLALGVEVGVLWTLLRQVKHNREH